MGNNIVAILIDKLDIGKYESEYFTYDDFKKGKLTPEDILANQINEDELKEFGGIKLYRYNYPQLLEEVESLTNSIIRNVEFKIGEIQNSKISIIYIKRILREVYRNTNHFFAEEYIKEKKELIDEDSMSYNSNLHEYAELNAYLCFIYETIVKSKFEDFLKDYEEVPDNTKQEKRIVRIQPARSCDSERAETIELSIDQETKVLWNYQFWESSKRDHKNNIRYKNIFEGITKKEFLGMVSRADFSVLDKRGIKQRVQYNIFILSQVLGDNWGGVAARSLGVTLIECQKRTEFEEHAKLRALYLT